jgi:5-(carboxyamino)imidazole ribonucleotide synthase
VTDQSILYPGSVIGILGGGQLGRMTAMAARSCGYRIKVLDPDPDCAARPLADAFLCSDFADVDAVTQLAQDSHVVTVELENIPILSLKAAAQQAPLRPGWDVIQIIQDRARQKLWLHDHHFPCAPFRVAQDAEMLAAALRELGSPCFVKTTRGGYDGRGQIIATQSEDAAQILATLGSSSVVVEQAIAIEQELSVLVARSVLGEVVVFPVACSQHSQRILTWSVLPASQISAAIAAQAQDIARAAAESLQLVGLLAVEFFLTTKGELLINELAPRPHNTFHATERALCISQFEQHVRAVCGLPLGAPQVICPSAIVNLLGDLWLPSRTPSWTKALQVPTVRLHLYEKKQPRPGRKMGHLSAVGTTQQEALERVLLAYSLLQSDR